MNRIKSLILKGKYNFYVSTFLGIVLSLWVSHILVKDNSITSSGGTILSILGTILFITLFYILEVKFRLDEFYNLKSKTDTILNSYAESELLQDKFNTILNKDLKLDCLIKKSNKTIKQQHLFLLKLKIDEYFLEFFEIDVTKKIIKNIPKYFFTERIWPKFIEISPCYYSTQKLTSDQAEKYFDDEDRKIKEVRTLKERLEGENSTILKKLFVIDNSDFTDGKISNDKIIIYLNYWRDKFPQEIGTKFPIRVINSYNMEISLETEIDDIGIFGDVFGIQTTREINKKTFNQEDLQIDFYFDKDECNKRKKSFLKQFDLSKGLSTVLD